jgi:hypothetical protein
MKGRFLMGSAFLRIRSLSLRCSIQTVVGRSGRPAEGEPVPGCQVSAPFHWVVVTAAGPRAYLGRPHNTGPSTEERAVSLSIPFRQVALLTVTIALVGPAVACDDGDGDTVADTVATDTASADTTDDVAEDTTPDVAEDTTAAVDTTPVPTTVVLLNNGTSDLEGHTPRGFQGSGTGLFAGDNLNPGFPNDDGLQFYVTFDLNALPLPGDIVSATFRAKPGTFHATGTPFADLGNLNAEAMRYEAFGTGLFDDPAHESGFNCVFATSIDGPHSCDVTSLVTGALDDSWSLAQLRLKFDTVSDGDNAQDLAAYYLTGSNTNAPGIFELEVTVIER